MSATNQVHSDNRPIKLGSDIFTFVSFNSHGLKPQIDTPHDVFDLTHRLAGQNYNVVSCKTKSSVRVWRGKVICKLA